ncbi:MAG: serine protease inhibitor [Fimbriimonadales bacterium]|nr:MAG: serine protease inhibitor [Fimbriimonadales bacterium]
MKPWTLGIAIATSAVLISGIWLLNRPSPTTTNQTHTTQQQPTTPNSELLNGSNQFAFNLFKEITRAGYEATGQRPTIVRDRSPNSIFSPLGVQFVLTLFLNGAEGETYDEIAHALGFQHASLEAINQFHLDIQQRLRRWQADSKLVLANSIWTNPSSRLHPDFERVGKAYYALEAYQVDFSNPVEAARRINEWAKQKTHGFVPKVLEPREITSDTILAIANALYLRALWAQPFQVLEEPLEFNLESGKRVKVPGMEATLEGVPYVKTELCEIVGLPYRGGDWVCYVVLPRSGLSVEELVSELDAARWEEWLGQMKAQQVQVVMPRFEVKSEYDLIPALKELGIRQAFARGGFPRILAGEDAGYINLFKQVGRVRVDERGTEAAAVTIAMTRAVVLTPFVVDRPFVFVISDRSSGVILFMGIVRAPSG